MLDKLMESFGGDVVNQLTQNAGISMDQAKSVLPIAQESLQSGLMEQVTGGNIGGILGMFNSGGDALQSNPIFSGIKGMFMQNVMTKMGLPESVAGMVAGTGMTSVVGNLTNALKGDGGEVTQDGMMEKLGLGGSDGLMDMAKNMAQDKLGDALGGLGDAAGGIGDKLGGMFGK